MMKTYLVGGAVRDTLLGKIPKDRDWVIVGATQEDIQAMLEQGFTQVGKDFPVFLHPQTNEEYALARTERKTGVGYAGFECYSGPDVTLVDDLSRRDLTINSMAMDVGTGEIFDPFGGQEDLKSGIIRHTTDAFAEDPLRVLRVARFISRYGFVEAPATAKLCRQLVESGEVAAISADRLWIEWEKIMAGGHVFDALAFLRSIGVNSHANSNAIPGLMFFNAEHYDELVYRVRTGGAVSPRAMIYLSMENLTDFPKKTLAAQTRVPAFYVKSFNLFNSVYAMLTAFNHYTDDYIYKHGGREGEVTPSINDVAKIFVDEWRAIRSGGLLHNGTVSLMTAASVIRHHPSFALYGGLDEIAHDILIIEDVINTLSRTSMAEFANDKDAATKVYAKQKQVAAEVLSRVNIRL